MNRVSFVPFKEEHHFSLIEQLTDLLHRAYAPLAAQGMKYAATHQPPESTLRRLKQGEAYLLFLQEELIGTVTLYAEQEESSCEYYRRKGVYSFGQFAVSPELQGKGIGSIAMDLIERRALERGAREIALDTAETALHLIKLYEKRGYKIVDSTKWDSVNYRSVIMTKTL